MTASTSRRSRGERVPVVGPFSFGVTRLRASPLLPVSPRPGDGRDASEGDGTQAIAVGPAPVRRAALVACSSSKIADAGSDCSDGCCSCVRALRAARDATRGACCRSCRPRLVSATRGPAGAASASGRSSPSPVPKSAAVVHFRAVRPWLLTSARQRDRGPDPRARSRARRVALSRRSGQQ